MAGNSQRRGRRAGLQGKGPTPPAERRVWHKAYSGSDPVPERTARKQERERRAAEAAGRRPRVGTPGTLPDGPKREPRQPGRPAGPGRSGAGRSGGSGRSGSGELVLGRNPVLEALRAGIPASTLYLARGIDLDERVNELLQIVADRGLAIVELTRAELDKLADGVPHQGVGLPVPAYRYRRFDDLLADLAGGPGGAGAGGTAAPLLVALDGVTDPRNLGAVIRSAAGFGGHGVVVPERRAAGVTAAAWRASAGAAARVPVARVTNLTRALKTCQQAGLLVVGLDGDADQSLYDLDLHLATDPLVLVVGSEGRGLSRLVRATCDLRVAIPMADSAGVGSLNASVAAAVALAEVTRRRRTPS